MTKNTSSNTEGRIWISQTIEELESYDLTSKKLKTIITKAIVFYLENSINLYMLLGIVSAIELYQGKQITRGLKTVINKINALRQSRPEEYARENLNVLIPILEALK